jgi:hypothetical protein
MFFGMTAHLRRRFCVQLLAPGVLVLADGDAAGEGLATGLAVITGVLVALGEGDAAAEGLTVAGVDSVAGSAAQPAAKPIDTVARSRSAARLMQFIFELLIILFLVRARLKSRMMIARTRVSSNECSHSLSACLSCLCVPKPSFRQA